MIHKIFISFCVILFEISTSQAFAMWHEVIPVMEVAIVTCEQTGENCESLKSTLNAFKNLAKGVDCDLTKVAEMAKQDPLEVAKAVEALAPTNAPANPTNPKDVLFFLNCVEKEKSSWKARCLAKKDPLERGGLSFACPLGSKKATLEFSPDCEDILVLPPGGKQDEGGTKKFQAALLYKKWIKYGHGSMLEGGELDPVEVENFKTVNGLGGVISTLYPGEKHRLVQPYMPGNLLTEVRAQKKQKKSSDLVTNLKVASQVVSGLENIHGKGIFHADIKLENILFLNGVALFTDFGDSVDLNKSPKGDPEKELGTPEIRAPELLTLRRKAVNLASLKGDVFSTAVALFLFRRQEEFPSWNHCLDAYLGQVPGSEAEALAAEEARECIKQALAPIRKELTAKGGYDAWLARGMNPDQHTRPSVKEYREALDGVIRTHLSEMYHDNSHFRLKHPHPTRDSNSDNHYFVVLSRNLKPEHNGEYNLFLHNRTENGDDVIHLQSDPFDRAAVLNEVEKKAKISPKGSPKISPTKRKGSGSPVKAVVVPMGSLEDEEH